MASVRSTRQRTRALQAEPDQEEPPTEEQAMQFKQEMRRSWQEKVDKAYKTCEEVEDGIDDPILKSNLRCVRSLMRPSLQAVLAARYDGISVMKTGLSAAMVNKIMTSFAKHADKVKAVGRMLDTPAGDMQGMRHAVANMKRQLSVLPIIGGSGMIVYMRQLQLALVISAALVGTVAKKLGKDFPAALGTTPSEALLVPTMGLSDTDLGELLAMLPRMLEVFTSELALGLLETLPKVRPGSPLHTRFAWVLDDGWLDDVGSEIKLATLAGTTELVKTLDAMDVFEQLELLDAVAPRNELYLRAQILNREGLGITFGGADLPPDLTLLGETAGAVFTCEALHKLLVLVGRAYCKLLPSAAGNAGLFRAVKEIDCALSGLSAVFNCGARVLDVRPHELWVSSTEALARKLVDYQLYLELAGKDTALYQQLVLTQPEQLLQLKAPKQPTVGIPAQAQAPWFAAKGKHQPDGPPLQGQQEVAADQSLAEAAQRAADSADIAPAQAVADFLEEEARGMKRPRT